MVGLCRTSRKIARTALQVPSLARRGKTLFDDATDRPCSSWPREGTIFFFAAVIRIRVTARRLLSFVSKIRIRFHGLLSVKSRRTALRRLNRRNRRRSKG